MFIIGLDRGIKEDDIYSVTNSLRSDQNTLNFSEQWHLEYKTKKPSLFRIMLKTHGWRMITIFIFYFIGCTLAK